MLHSIAYPEGLMRRSYCTPSHTRFDAVLLPEAAGCQQPALQVEEVLTFNKYNRGPDPNTSSVHAPRQRAEWPVPSVRAPVLYRVPLYPVPTFRRGGGALFAFFALEDDLPLVVDAFFFATLLTMAEKTAVLSRLG